MANAVSIRAIMSVANELDWNMDNIDVSTAYLNSPLDDDIKLYITPPPGLQTTPGHTLRLVKALYGTMQGGHAWAKLKAATLKRLGFIRNGAEPCMWTRRRTNVDTGQKDVVMLCVIVDDFIVTGNSQEAIDGFKDSIRKVWSITDFGAPTVHDRLLILR